VVAAVQLSHRYIPARQLPDKAVSLLDTASARVAISQSATPAMVEDARVAIEALESEKVALLRDAAIGAGNNERVGAIDGEIEALKGKLAKLEEEWAIEQKLVGEIRSLRSILAPKPDGSELKSISAPEKSAELEPAPTLADQASPKEARNLLRE